jgi:hypothetical protein
MDLPKSQVDKRDRLKNELMKRLNMDSDYKLTEYKTSTIMDLTSPGDH